MSEPVDAPCVDCARVDLPLHVDYRCTECHQEPLVPAAPPYDVIQPDPRYL